MFSEESIMKYAVIGCGRISELHIKAALDCGLEFVGLCDKIREKALGRRTLLPTSDGVGIYTDFIELLETEKPELVCVTTDSGNHAKMAIECIKRGIHTIIEKPIALSIHDAREIVRLADEMGVCVCSCHQNRFNKSVVAIHDAVEDGRFGRLFHGCANIRWERDKSYYDLDTWRGTWHGDGGTLMNQGIHNIDLLRWLMGSDIDEVFAYTDRLNHDYIEAEDLGLALIKFSNGSYGVIEGTSNMYPDDFEETLCIFGKYGRVKAGGQSVNTIEEWNFADESVHPEDIKKATRESPPNVYGFGHGALYKDVVDAINKGRKPYITAEDGMRAVELVLAIYKSAAEGKPVKLPLEDCATTDFIGRFEK